MPTVKPVRAARLYTKEFECGKLVYKIPNVELSWQLIYQRSWIDIIRQLLLPLFKGDWKRWLMIPFIMMGFAHRWDIAPLRGLCLEDLFRTISFVVGIKQAAITVLRLPRHGRARAQGDNKYCFCRDDQMYLCLALVGRLFCYTKDITRQDFVIRKVLCLLINQFAFRGVHWLCLTAPAVQCLHQPCLRQARTVDALQREAGNHQSSHFQNLFCGF